MSNKITHVDILSFPLGTGDCLIVKFHKENGEIFKIMIDAGCWSGSYKHIRKYIKKLKEEVDNEVDILIVTHEHKDHVYAFEAAKELFTTDFKAKEIWMSWTEDEKNQKVRRWKKDYGQKKKALAMAVKELEKRTKAKSFGKEFNGLKYEKEMKEMRVQQKEVIKGFADLNISLDNQLNLKEYKGGMEGMLIAKEDILKDEIRFHKQGQVIENHPNAEGLKFYVLGPPKSIYDVRKEHSSKEGESYEHSHNNDSNLAFEESIFNMDTKQVPLPFDEQYTFESKRSSSYKAIRKTYNDESWRKIDNDWLYSSGSLALRMNSLTNNLSLAIAIEIEDTNQVLLFPGDAEYGSWESWHDIDWENHQDPNKKHLTEDLLNRTVFYKVAHHMSHNGTARRLGLDMMNSSEMYALATLDYQVISSGWTNTMPNRFILDELIQKTQGRLIFNNEAGIDYESDQTLTQKLVEERGSLSRRKQKAWKDDYKKIEIEQSGSQNSNDPKLYYHQLTINI